MGYMRPRMAARPGTIRTKKNLVKLHHLRFSLFEYVRKFLLDER